MSVTLEQLPDEAIYIRTLNADFDFATEGADTMIQTTNILDHLKQPVIFILDASAINLSLDDMMGVASMATRQFDLLKHPNIIEGVMVSQSRMIELGVKGMDSAVFGNVKITVFPTR